MRLIVLDDFPVWTTYLLGVVVLCGFLFALAMLIRSWRVTKPDARGSWVGRQLWFLTIAGALAVWFLGSSMYFRFHAVEIDSEHVDLLYFWPRPAVILGSGDLVEVKLMPAHRTCGHLVVATQQEIFRSVNFRKCDNAEQVLSYMQGLKK